MIGQYKRDLSVVPYRSGWQQCFEQEADRLRNALGERAMQIEHIGSTSIPGMAAKPIIDITVAVASFAEATDLIPVVEALGYEYKPLDVIAERMFFAKESDPEIRTHHLSVTELGSAFWHKHLAFRDYLRAHDELAGEYVQLKKQIAEDYARTQQLDREAKTEFVSGVLALAEKERMNDQGGGRSIQP